MHNENTASGMCLQINIPAEACRLLFSAERHVRTEPIGTSSRGEMVIGKYDAHGHIVAIELVGDGKPRQES